MSEDLPQSLQSEINCHQVPRESYRRCSESNITKTNVIILRPAKSSVRYSCQHCGKKSIPRSQLRMHIRKECLNSQPEFVDMNFKSVKNSHSPTKTTVMDPLLDVIVKDELNPSTCHPVETQVDGNTGEPCNNVPVVSGSRPEVSGDLLHSPLDTNCEYLTETCEGSLELYSISPDIPHDLCVRESQDLHHVKKPQAKVTIDNTSCPITGRQKECKQKQLIPSPKRRHVSSKNCNFCTKTFASIHRLTLHEQRHLRNKCNLCDNFFNNAKALQAHNRKLHSGEIEEPKLCFKCGKTYASASQLVKHISSLRKAKDFSCDLCDFKSAQKHILKHHMTKHSSEKPHLCETCGKSFKSITSLRRHRGCSQFSGPHHVCQTCGESFSTTVFLNNHEFIMHGKDLASDSLRVCPVCGLRCTPSLLSDHMNSHTGELPYTCDLCPKKYSSLKCFLRHKLDHKKRDLPKLKTKCNLCDKEFISYAALNKHQLADHQADKNFVCNICNRRFLRRVGLMVHSWKCRKDKDMDIDDNDVPPAMFKCDDCGKLSKTRTLLIKHMELAHGNDIPRRSTPGISGPYTVECKVCNRMYATEDTLWVHQVFVHRVCSGIVDLTGFSCPLCMKSFKTDMTVKTHIRTAHLIQNTTAPEENICSHCGKMCLNKVSLARHMSVHGVKKITCPECDMKFRTAFHLKSHMTTHTGERPYKCELCDQSLLSLAPGTSTCRISTMCQGHPRSSQSLHSKNTRLCKLDRVC